MALTKISRSLLDTGISDSSDATAITINSSEQVGIGVSPSATLQLKAASGNTGLYLQDAAGSPNISWLDAGGTVQWQVYSTMGGANGLDPLVIYSSAGEVARIDTSGNIGIGTTTISSGTLGTSNKFLEVAAGTASGSGTLVLSRNTSTNNDEVGGIRYVNANNADDDGLDADGKMVAAISARAVTSDSNAGDDSGGVLTFSTKPEAGSFTERMRIDSSGNVGIGATSLTSSIGWTPKLVLDATSAAVVFKGINSQENAVGISNGLYLDSMGSTTGSYNNFYFRNTSTNSSFSASERMRVDASGYLYVGTISRIASGTVNVENVGVANCFTAQVSNNAYYNFAGNNSSGTTTFYVQGDGDYYFAGTSQSDRDLKENIQPINESSLAKVKLLQPKTFNFKESEGYATNTKTGFIAQEVAEIFGTETGVASGTDGKKDMGIDTTGIVAHLTKAIQEQQEQIEALQSEINTLKGE